MQPVEASPQNAACFIETAEVNILISLNGRYMLTEAATTRPRIPFFSCPPQRGELT